MINSFIFLLTATIVSLNFLTDHELQEYEEFDKLVMTEQILSARPKNERGLLY